MNKFFQILLFIISAWLLPFIILAQAPEIEWQRTIGGTGIDKLIKVIEITHQGFITLGTTNSCNGIVPEYKGNDDVLIVMFDYSGNIKWVKSWGGSLDEKPVDAFYNPNIDLIWAKAGV